MTPLRRLCLLAWAERLETGLEPVSGFTKEHTAELRQQQLEVAQRLRERAA